MSAVIRIFTIADLPAATALWQATAGLGDTPAPAQLARFLDRNPGLSQAAVVEGRLVGCLLASFDGIRGYLYRLAVEPTQRRRGVARALVAAAVDALRAAGADRCNLHTYLDNADAHAFWPQVGWRHDPRVAFWSRRW